MTTADEQLLSIECVSLLFWNYTSDDIAYLRRQSRDFDYVWDTYLDPVAQTYGQLWDFWQVKFSYATKRLLIGYALSRFGPDRMKTIAFSEQLSTIARQFEARP